MTSIPARLSQGTGGLLIVDSSPSSEPVVKLDPASGPVGTRIEVTGSGFGSDLAGQRHIIITLNREFADGCGLVGGIRVNHLNIRKNGNLTGELVVMARGDCFQEPGRHHAVTPGQYELAIGCMACNVHSFQITRD
jgi:hypothetical protein